MTWRGREKVQHSSWPLYEHCNWTKVHKTTRFILASNLLSPLSSDIAKAPNILQNGSLPELGTDLVAAWVRGAKDEPNNCGRHSYSSNLAAKKHFMTTALWVCGFGMRGPFLFCGQAGFPEEGVRLGVRGPGARGFSSLAGA